MATTLCGTQVGANTGSIGCDFTRGLPKIIMLGSATFAPGDYADTATMDAAILGKLKLPTGSSQKLYPFPAIQGTTDQTEAAKFGNSGYGLRTKMAPSVPAYEFQVIAGSTLEKKLKAFDGVNTPLLIYDDKGQIWGAMNGTNYGGSVWQVSVEPHAYGDGQNQKFTLINISLVEAADFVENAYAYKTSLNASSFRGLKDGQLVELSHVTNVYKIKVKIPVSGLNQDLDVWDDYGALIAALTFTAGTGANYATPLAITSVAADNTLKALTVTFDSSAFTALASLAKIRLSSPLPAVLDAAGVTQLEIAPVIITKP